MDPAGVFATTYQRDQALIRTRAQAISLLVLLARQAVARDELEAGLQRDQGRLGQVEQRQIAAGGAGQLGEEAGLEDLAARRIDERARAERAPAGGARATGRR